MSVTWQGSAFARAPDLGIIMYIFLISNWVSTGSAHGSYLHPHSLHSMQELCDNFRGYMDLFHERQRQGIADSAAGIP